MEAKEANKMIESIGKELQEITEVEGKREAVEDAEARHRKLDTELRI